MIPCTTRRWLLAVRATGLNGEPFSAWALTRAGAERRWMLRYDEWASTGWRP